MSQKTKVLLAFGRHGSDLNRSSERDKRFFRRSIVPFLQEHVIGGKRPVTIIYDTVITPSMGKPYVRSLLSGKLTSQKRRIAMRELSRMLAEFSPNGAPIELVNAYLIETENFGFEKFISRMDPDSLARIRAVMEPQIARAIYLSLLSRRHIKRAEKMDSQGKLDQLILEVMKHIQFSAKSIVLRDRAVLQLVEYEAAEDPKRVFVIARGLAHHGMSLLFDETRFDITKVCDERSHNLFAIPAVIALAEDLHLGFRVSDIPFEVHFERAVRSLQ